MSFKLSGKLERTSFSSVHCNKKSVSANGLALLLRISWSSQFSFFWNSVFSSILFEDPSSSSKLLLILSSISLISFEIFSAHNLELVSFVSSTNDFLKI